MVISSSYRPSTMIMAGPRIPVTLSRFLPTNLSRGRITRGPLVFALPSPLTLYPRRGYHERFHHHVKAHFPQSKTNWMFGMVISAPLLFLATTMNDESSSMCSKTKIALSQFLLFASKAYNHSSHWNRVYCDVPAITPGPLLAGRVKRDRLNVFTSAPPPPPLYPPALLWHFIKDDALLISCVVLVTCATAALNIYIPIAMGELVSSISALAASTFITMPGGLGITGLGLRLKGPAAKLLILFSAQGFLTFTNISLISWVGENLSFRLRSALYKSFLTKPILFFDQHLQAELMGRITQDVAEFKSTFKQVITQGLKSVAQVLGSAVNLISISHRLSFILAATTPFLYAGMNAYGIYLRALSKLAREAESECAGVAGEVLSNIRTVRSFVAEERELIRYQDALSEANGLNCNLGFHIGIFQGLTNMCIGSLTLLVLYFGGSMVVEGQLTSGKLMTFLIATQNAQKSLTSTGILFSQSVKAAGSMGRIFEFMDKDASFLDTSGHLNAPDRCLGDIQFRDVSFSYPSRPDHPVLHDFNLWIPQGCMVALCGQSGCGKSTAGQLLERFYTPDAGQLLVDGIDITDLEPSWIRSHVGYISQEPVLFHTSILENIRYGHPQATLEEVRKAAELANAASFIDSFPQGYDTLVGERGASLSGGQKQRIAIARAILKDPQILLLDEATSALDATAERQVQEALETLMRGRTVLVIAHRLSTIQGADRIVVMRSPNHGGSLTSSIVEQGTHQHLMQKRGVYANLYHQATVSTEHP